MRYILIISEDRDLTASEVVHWLLLNGEFQIIRINETDKIKILNISIDKERESNFSIEINDRLVIKSDQIYAYWYRRGELAYNKVVANSGNIKIADLLNESLNKYYNIEWETATEYIYYLLRKSRSISINSWFDLKTNKLINLEVAKQIGLSVPETIVSNDIQHVIQFVKRNKTVISKPLSINSGSFWHEKYFYKYSIGTKLITLEDLNEVQKEKKSFQPTLFQEYIDKDFEIRSFYFNGQFYSMAIFSQNNPKTQIDFRNYDQSLPNRNVPFKLPVDIECKLGKLMTVLDYDSGSFDIIYNKGEYVFLEVNTVGQLSWVSKNCNYQIEKIIANEIIRRAKY